MADDEKAWPVRCACGKQYAEERWETLRLVGRQASTDELELEMRICVCGSTISVRVAPARPR